jgi:protein-S-isoprenylcysteine O-methyltransferase Ste14
VANSSGVSPLSDHGGMPEPRRLPQLVALAAKVIAAAALSVFVVRVWNAYLLQHRPSLLLLLAGEVITVVLVLLARTPKAVTIDPLACVCTLCGTFYFLYFSLAPGVALIPWSVSVAVQSVAISWQIIAKLSLGNRFGLLPANRGIVTTGPYAVVRHPIYFGYFLNHLGYFLGAASWTNAGLFAVLYGFQIARLFQEEALLMQDEVYRAYASRVRWRFLPGVF